MTHMAVEQRKVILWVEDERDLREDVAEELEDDGFLVIQVANGIEALKELETLQPDLILCDITMPEMSGYELLDIVRQERSDLTDIPFVFLTAQADSKQVVEGKLAGADDYLVKPIDFDLMLATIQARITQMARIRQRHKAELTVMMQAFDRLHEQRARDAFEHIGQAFDYVRFGIVLLDRQSRVQFANRAAQRMACTIAGMSLNGDFVLGGGRTMGEFRTIFDNLLCTDESNEDMIECLTLSRMDGGRDLLAMVCALDSRHAMRPDDPVVMMLISDPSHRPPIAAGALISLFSLTPTEAEIANAFADGKRTDQIALDFQISSTTVAFHKRNIFEKTGTNRQADLIALLLSLPADSSM